MTLTNIFGGYLEAQQRLSRRKRMGWIKVEPPKGYVLTDDDKKFIADMKAEGGWGDPADAKPRRHVPTGEFVNEKPVLIDFNEQTGE